MAAGEGAWRVRRAPIVERVRSRRTTGAASSEITAPVAVPLWRAVVGAAPTERTALWDVLVTDGRARLVKSRAARLWFNRALSELRPFRPARPLGQTLALDCRIATASGAAVFDDAPLLELLERAAVIADRRQIRLRRLVAVTDADAAPLELVLTRHDGAAS